MSAAEIKTQNHNKVQVICRIRAPLQSELFPSNNTISKQSSLLVDQKYSIFSSQSQAESSLIVTTKNPIKGKLIEKHFKSDKDIINYQGNILEDSRIFRFDRVFNNQTSQKKIYNHVCKDKIQQLLNGFNSTVLLYGASKTGKNYTLRGLEAVSESGLLIYAVEEIFAYFEIEKQQKKKIKSSKYVPKLSIQLYSIVNEQLIDLLNPLNKDTQIEETLDHSPFKQQIRGLSQVEIKNVIEFKNYYRQAHTQVRNNQNNFQKESQKTDAHFVVSLQIDKLDMNDEAQFAKINFVKLADPTTEQNNTKHFDLECLQQYLIYCSKNSIVQRDNYLYNKCLLTHALRDTLNEETQITLLCLVSGQHQNFNNNLESLKYCAYIYDCVEHVSTSRYNGGESQYDSICSPERQISTRQVEKLLKDFEILYQDIFSFSNKAQSLTRDQIEIWLNNKEFSLQQFEKLCLNSSDDRVYQDQRVQNISSKVNELWNYIKTLKQKFIFTDEAHNEIQKIRNSSPQQGVVSSHTKVVLSNQPGNSNLSTQQKTGNKFTSPTSTVKHRQLTSSPNVVSSKIQSPNPNATMKQSLQSSLKNDPKHSNITRKTSDRNIENNNGSLYVSNHNITGNLTSDLDYKSDQYENEVTQDLKYRNYRRELSKSKLEEQSSLNSAKDQILIEKNFMLAEKADKIKYLQEMIQNSDRELRHLEEELKGKDLQLIQEKERYRQNQDLVKEIMNKQQLQIQEKSQQLSELTENLRSKEQLYIAENRRHKDQQAFMETQLEKMRELLERETQKCKEYKEENENYKVEIYEKKQPYIIKLEENKIIQESQISELKLRLDEQIDRNSMLNREKEYVKQQLSDIRQTITVLDTKNRNNRKKFESERDQILGEKIQEQNQNNEKMNQLKKRIKSLEKEALDYKEETKQKQHQIDQLRDNISKLNESNKELSILLTHQQDENQTLKLEIDKTRQQKEDYLSQLQKEKQVTVQQANQLIQLQDAIDNIDQDRTKLIDQLKQEQTYIEELEKNFNTLENQKMRLDSYVVKLENKIEDISEQSNQNIDELDAKFQKIVLEYQQLTDENQTSRATQSEYILKITRLEDLCQSQQKQLFSLQQECANYKQAYEEIDGYMKNLIYQKHSQIRDIQDYNYEEEQESLQQIELENLNKSQLMSKLQQLEEIEEKMKERQQIQNIAKSRQNLFSTY